MKTFRGVAQCRKIQNFFKNFVAFSSILEIETKSEILAISESGSGTVLK